jgi:hypothetical protein
MNSTEIKQKVKKTKAELKKDLADQLLLLKTSCKLYDEGLEIAALQFSVTLRILLHHRGRNTRALLEQLGIREKRFYDTVGKLDPRNLASDIKLVRIAWKRENLSDPVEINYEPNLDDVSRIWHTPFSEWWNQPVIKDNEKYTMSRLDLVCSVADSDGGAHVDPELGFVYHRISRLKTTEMFRFSDENGRINILNRLELACLRQIAHETIKTIERHMPEMRDKNNIKM